MRTLHRFTPIVAQHRFAPNSQRYAHVASRWQYRNASQEQIMQPSYPLTQSYSDQSMHNRNLHRPPTTTLAPSFPNTPASIGFGLLSLPFFRLRKPNTAVGLCLPMVELPLLAFRSSDCLVSLFRSPQLPCSSSTTCTPPPLLAVLVPPLPGCPLELLCRDVVGWLVGPCCC